MEMGKSFGTFGKERIEFVNIIICRDVSTAASQISNKFKSGFMKKMLNVESFQETLNASMCGPASLKIVLNSVLVSSSKMPGMPEPVEISVAT